MQLSLELDLIRWGVAGAVADGWQRWQVWIVGCALVADLSLVAIARVDFIGDHLDPTVGQSHAVAAVHNVRVTRLRGLRMRELLNNNAKT